VLGLLPGWCGVLILARWAYLGEPHFRFFVWNLFLAAVPAFASTQLGRSARARAQAVVQISWFGLWLLFLPNAPYIVTDLIHLEPRPPVPFWFDLALFVSCAGTGLMLGYASTAEVQRVVAARFGEAASWGVAAGALFLSGFGIYLGRFLRWNSWDVVSRPAALLGELGSRLFDPGGRPRTIAVTVVYGVGLVLGYLALRVVVHADPTPAPGPDSRPHDGPIEVTPREG
jgi:uncharacterized membrane protein